MISPFDDLGPCEAEWNSITLSPMFGTVNKKSELLVADLKEDGQGDIKVGAVTIGRQVSIEIPMTRTTLAKLATVVHGSITSGNLQVNNDVGIDLYESAQELILKPMVNNVPTTDTSKWIHVFKTHPRENFELQFDNQNQRVMVVDFLVFPDQSSATFGRLWRVGPAAA